MPGSAAAGFDADREWLQIQLVMEDNQVLGRAFVELSQWADTFSGKIHEGLRLCDQNFFALKLCDENFRVEFALRALRTPAFDQTIGGEEADIMAGSFVLYTWITQTNDDFHGSVQMKRLLTLSRF